MKKLLATALLTSALMFTLPIGDSHAKDGKHAAKHKEHREAVKEHKEEHREAVKERKEEHRETVKERKEEHRDKHHHED